MRSMHISSTHMCSKWHFEKACKAAVVAKRKVRYKVLLGC